MNKVVAGLWFVLAVLSVHADEYRIFTDMQGREIKAKIMEFDSGKGKIQIERQDGRKVWVKPGIFAETDRNYIREWVVATEMMSEQNLRVSFKKKSKQLKEEKSSYNGSRFEGQAVQYEVTVENRSSQPVDDLILKYCYLIEVDVKGGDKTFRQAVGQLIIEGIGAHSSRTVSSSFVRLGERIGTSSEKINGTVYLDDKTESDETLKGILLRIEGPLVEGKPAVRIVSYPRDLQERANDAGVEWEEAKWSPELERVSMRGEPGSMEELQAWVIDDLREINGENNPAAIRTILRSFSHYPENRCGLELCRAVAMACYHAGEYGLALEWAQKQWDEGSANLKWKISMAFVLAELYATDPALCDGEKAVEYAQLIRSVKHNAGWYCVLAAACARNGQFEKAVDAQENALRGLEGEQKKKYQTLLERQLALYKAGKPYEREPDDPPLRSYCLKVTTGENIGEEGEVVFSFGSEDALIQDEQTICVYLAP